MWITGDSLLSNLRISKRPLKIPALLTRNKGTRGRSFLFVNKIIKRRSPLCLAWPNNNSRYNSFETQLSMGQPVSSNSLPTEETAFSFQMKQFISYSGHASAQKTLRVFFAKQLRTGCADSPFPPTSNDGYILSFFPFLNRSHGECR